jgi:antitoxin VapB
MITTNLTTEGIYQIVKLPKEFEFTGTNQVEIRKRGNTIIITPVRKNWKSFADIPQADDDFLLERPDILETDRVLF